MNIWILISDQQIKTELLTTPDNSIISDGNSLAIMNILEPLVQISTDTKSERLNPNEPEVQIFVENSSNGVQPSLPPTVMPKAEPSEMKAKLEHMNFFENIGLFENSNTVAKIGECTISVSNSSASNSTVQSVANSTLQID